MTKTQRKELETIASKLDELETAVQEILDQEQGRYDDMSEKAQEGTKGEALQSQLGELEDVVSQIEHARETLDGIANQEIER